MIRSVVCLLGVSLLVLAEVPLRFATTRQLFVDEYLILEKRSVSLKLNSPATREVVLAADKPWEGISISYPCVFKDGSRFRLYYRASGPPRGVRGDQK